MASLATAFLALSSLFLAPSVAGPLSRRAAPLLPANDPFYQPPAGYQNTAPGTILRNRTITASLGGAIPLPVQAYQLLYRTTAVNGTPIATVTTIFKPADSFLDRFVSFQTAYDSSASKCDPSYTYQEGAQQNDLITTVEEFAISGLLLSGYLVAAPDYEGPDTAFGPGHLEGMGVLDGMRAVQSFAPLGLTSNAAIVGVGYSGGALATGWAASLQRTYAPSLNIKGWSAGGTPANLTGTTVYLDNTAFSGFLPAAVDGLLKPSAYQAQLAPTLRSVITPYGQSILDFANANCAVDDIIAFPFQSILSTTVQTAGPALLYNPTVKQVLDQNIMGIHTNQTPIAPVYLYHASGDEVIPYANASTLASNWCAQGASVQFTTFPLGGHITTEILGYPGVLIFIAEAFAGIVPNGCALIADNRVTINSTSAGSKVQPALAGMKSQLPTIGLQDANVIANRSILRG